MIHKYFDTNGNAAHFFFHVATAVGKQIVIKNTNTGRYYLDIILFLQKLHMILKT